jgi:hypothetical protein
MKTTGTESTLTTVVSKQDMLTLSFLLSSLLKIKLVPILLVGIPIQLITLALGTYYQRTQPLVGISMTSTSQLLNTAALVVKLVKT